tara:strand:+ start:979 stop:2310 length:1332 start_codon:yes stop_codon:yes gene_type:complete
MALLQQSKQEYYSGTDYGGYQFMSLENIIDQFKIAYVGEDKIISKVSRTDVAFHAQRALQELSFDTLKSCKAQEIVVPATLQMTLPQDYVNYTKISWVDSAGIKHLLYPTSKTSNPSSNPLQDSAGDFKLQAVGEVFSSSHAVTLDGEYKDIVVGMVVTGPYIPADTFVGATTNSGGATTIELQDTAGVDVLPDFRLSGATLTFTKSDFTLVKPQKSAHIIESLTWNLTNFKITAAAASDFASIEVGMIVSHDDFPIGTKVINVYNDIVVVDKLPTAASGSANGEVTFISPDADTDTWANYKSSTPSENNNDDYEDDTYWPLDGERYGLDPQHAQANGSFYIDCVSGKIHFSSNISGKTVILDYISDSLGTDAEMQVHKFAEEAMYRSILHGIASNRIQTQQLVPRLKKEKFAAVRQAKLRLSNIKLEELTQILRGKSKQIKH